MRPVIIRYRGKNQKLMSVKADYCHGEIPAYSNTFYWIFELNKKEVARVAESRIVREDRQKASILYGRPWLKKLADVPAIRLNEGDIYDYSVPDDAIQLWTISGFSAQDYWIVECTNRTILHVINNPERTVRGSFNSALKKLFAGKKIYINRLVTRTEEI